MKSVCYVVFDPRNEEILKVFLSKKRANAYAEDLITAGTYWNEEIYPARYIVPTFLVQKIELDNIV